MSGPQQQRSSTVFSLPVDVGRAADLGVPRSRVSIATPSIDIVPRESRSDESSRRIAFLEDQVKRLQAELALHLDTRPSDRPVEFPFGPNYDGPLPPWIGNMQALNPLLLSYDDRIKELKHHNKTHRDELVRVNAEWNLSKARVEELLEENKQLMNELRKALRGASQQESDVGPHPVRPQPISAEDVGIFDILRQENQVLVDETKLLRVEIAHLKASISELEQEKAHLGQKVHQQYGLLQGAHCTVQRLKQDNQQLKNEAQSLREAIDGLEKTRDGLTAQLESARNEIVDYQSTMAACRNKLGELGSLLSAEQQNLKRANEQLAKADHDREDLKSQLRVAQREIDVQKNEQEKLAKNIAGLEQQLASSQQNEFEALRKIKEVMEAVEKVTLERDQSLAREEGLQKECERLHAKVQKVGDSAVVSAKAQVSSAQEQVKNQLRSLEEESKAMQVQRAEMQVALDRALRDKKTAEAELERIVRAMEREKAGPPHALDELTKRLAATAKERDEMSRTVESTRAQLRRIQQSTEDERATERERISRLESRLTATTRALEESDRDRSKKAAECDDLKRKAGDLETLVKRVEKTHEDCLASQKLSHQKETDKLTARVADLEQKTSELQAQHDRASRERERTIESTKADLESVRQSLEAKIAELTKRESVLLTERETLAVKIAALEVEKQLLTDEREDISDERDALQVLNAGLERKLEDANGQIKALLAREAKLLRTNKDLGFKIDQLSLEKERLERDLLSTAQSLECLKNQSQSRSACCSGPDAPTLNIRGGIGGIQLATTSLMLSPLGPDFLRSSKSRTIGKTEGKDLLGALDEASFGEIKPKKKTKHRSSSKTRKLGTESESSVHSTREDRF